MPVPLIKSLAIPILLLLLLPGAQEASAVEVQSRPDAKRLLLAGKKLYESGKTKRAVKVLKDALDHPLYGPISAIFLARCYARLGAHEKSEHTCKSFLKKHPDSPYKEIVRHQLLDAVYRQGKAETRELLLSLLSQASEEEKPALLLKAARHERRLGNLDKAETCYQRLYIDHPASLEGLEAAKEAAWLVFNGKLPPPEFSNTDRLERAGNLHRRGRFDLAAATYRKLLEKDPGNQDLKIKLARALYKKRDNTDAIDLLKEILGSKITAEQRSEAVHLLSLLFWRVDMAKEFEKTCDYLREDGSLRFKKKAVFNLGAHHLEQGRLDKANHYFSEYLKLEKARSARSAVLWKKAWIHYHQDQFMDAARSFRKAAESSPGASLTNPATYWEARALLQSGKQKRAIDLLKRVVVRAPLDYYGQQAAALLESKGVRPPESPLFGRRFPDVSLTNKHRSHPHVAAALKLHETGFPEFAYLNLAALPSSMKSERPIAFLMARVSRAAGRHRRAYDILYRHFASFMQAPPSSAPKEFIDMAFPRLLFDETLRVARKHEMDPNLVWAVMRQESRYDATAVSPAGALGLMQVTPRATRLVAKHQQQIPAEAIEKILNPANNLRFGVKILADTLRSFDGALAPAIASYNADIRKVRQWVERGKHLDEDEFIDNIPYSETRLYVKKVLAGYRAYEYLHRKKDLASHW